MMRSAAFLALLPLLAAGCASTSMRREMDVSGTLPKLIGLGGFAPSCFMFCFIDNTTKQGDVIRDDAGPESFTIQSSSETLKVMPKKKSEPHLTVKPAKPVKPDPAH